MFLSTSTTLSTNPDATFPQKLQRQSIQMDGTSVMPLFDSRAEADKNSKIGLPWYFYVNLHSFRKLLRLSSNSLCAVRAIQVPTSNFHSPRSLSRKLSSTQCIIFPEKTCQEHQAGSPSVQISRADLTNALFFPLSSWFVLSHLQFIFLYSTRSGYVHV